MTDNQRVYPEAVENTLDVILESIAEMEFKAPMYFSALRDVIGAALFQHWLSGSDDPPFDTNGLLELLGRASAITILQQMEEEGLIDSIEDENGEEVVFVTKKGREAQGEANNFFTNLTTN